MTHGPALQFARERAQSVRLDAIDVSDPVFWRTDASGQSIAFGVAPNELTDLADRDPWLGTPWHKHVRARLEALASVDRQGSTPSAPRWLVR